MKKVLFTISDSFPYGAAYAARTRALCKLFQSIGYETVVLCDYASKEIEPIEYGKIVTVSETPYSGFARLMKLPLLYQKKLKELLEEDKYEMVVSRSMFDRFDKVLYTVKKYGIPLILESCEWYDVKGFARGKYDVRYFQFKHCFNNTYNKVDGVIAISKLLEKHYRQKGLEVVRIPGIHETKKLVYRIEAQEDSIKKFIFAGNIYGEKELFDDFIIALSHMNYSFILNVYGPDRKAVEAGLSDEGKKAFNQIIDKIMFYGMIPQEEMPNVCAKNDFGIFFRPDRRSSHAGFPTKLGEYLAAGTPVITNNTGDLSDIIINGENGFLLKNNDLQELIGVLEQCGSMLRSEYLQMRKNAHDTAITKLDYVVYKDQLETFVKSIRCKGV